MDDVDSILAALRLGSNLPDSVSASCATAWTKHIMPKEPCNLIISALHDFIQRERRTNFSFLSQHSHSYKLQDELLVVSRADTGNVQAVRKIAEHDTTAYNDWYTFTEQLRFDGFARTVAIDALPDKPVAVENLIITEFGRVDKNKLEAAAWIRNTYCTAEDDMWAMRLPEPQYEEQRLWWEGTGQAFRLLDLPLEMREAIYLQVIGPVMIPDIVAQRDGTEKLVRGNGQSFGDADRVGRSRDPDIQPPNMSIMRVSRQVQEEATQVANRDSIKRFTTLRTTGRGPSKSPLAIWRSLKQITTPYAFLKKLQLEMSATEYLAFAGICPLPGHPLNRSTVPINIPALARLRNLDTIDFRFISPEHDLAICPWNGPHSCQKKWIDLFFIYAWSGLKALRVSKGVKYTLSGCVKNSAREYWVDLLNDKIDHTADIKLLEQGVQASMTSNVALKCECSNPCAGGPRLFRVQQHEMRLIEGIQAELDKAYWDFED